MIGSSVSTRCPNHHVLWPLISHRPHALNFELIDEGFAAFTDAYARSDLLRGHNVRVHAAGAAREGIAAGVDERGALIVRHGKVATHYDSAEISVRAA